MNRVETMEGYALIKKWRIRRDITRLFRSKYRGVKSPEGIDAAIAESAPLRGRLMEMESAELLGRAMNHGIVPVDLLPLRFGSPLWREEAGHQYLSVEAKQALERAISAARRERMKLWLLWLGPAAGVIGALTGLVAVLRSVH